jgi:hypothetical protein
MKRYAWGSLNPLQLGRYAEYFVKMEFTMYGLDIYTSEVDDKGIDFVVRKGVNRYYDIQVKSVYKAKYIFFPKHVFELRDNLLATVVVFRDHEAPSIYLVRATHWQTPDKLFVSRDYVGRKSKPEYGVQLSGRNQALWSLYAFDKVVGTL